MPAVMPTEILTLQKCADGYYRTRWTDEQGVPRNRSFGRNATKARNRFNVFHEQWQNSVAVRSPDSIEAMTLQSCWEKFRKHADAYYVRKDGSPTGEAANFGDAMKLVLEHFGTEHPASFGVRKLKQVRQEMIRADLCVNVINARVRKIRQVFRWFTSELELDAGVWHGLQSLQALADGRAVDLGEGEFVTPRSTDPVGPVPEANVFAVANSAPATIRAMIMFQYWTGARPGETCALRQTELDTTGKAWLFKPEQHKTAHHKRRRIVIVGPKAQAVIAPFLSRSIDAYLFQPCEAWRQRCEMKIAAYQAQPGRGDYRQWPSYAERAEERTGRGGEHFDVRTYARTINRLCTDLNVPAWSPNQLRHNAATRLRQHFGLDVAQAALGHSRADITEIYAELDIAKASRAMEAVG